MRHVTVALERAPYDIRIGPGAFVGVEEVLAGRARVAVVTQAAVREHWAGRVLAALADAGCATEVFEIGDGEPAKSLGTVEHLCSRFAAWGLLRGDAVVALGGGVVGDTAGFAAAVYHRGIDYVQAPTTLLGQVDSAIGGKTGVNIHEGKNLVGAFHQPMSVLADVDALATLPERHYRSGLGEILKYACALDAGLAEIVLDRRDALLTRQSDVLEEVIARCASFKADVVTRDAHERTGLRSRLNYGHTLAHALETLSEFDLTHGEAVAVGVVFAGELARELRRIDDAGVARHRELVAALELPSSVPESHGAQISAARVVEQMRRDKKAAGGLTFVLAGAHGVDRVDDPSGRAVAAALAAVGIR